MFERLDKPRLFGVPPGADFPATLVEGLRAAFRTKPPEALARVQLIVNTRRMARRIRTLFDEGPPCLLPQLSLITEFGESFAHGDVPEAVSSLRRRLELSRLVTALIDAEPDIAPRSAIFDLSASLAALMDEMHGEGVTPEAIGQIDTGDQSGHWSRIQRFLGLLKPYFELGPDSPDIETRQRLVIEHCARLWASRAPENPIILAGSTGSRGATRLLMTAIARLPQGAVILPGFDFDQPQEVWDMLMSPDATQDHPQYRYGALLRELDLTASDVSRWRDAKPCNPARARLVSLALRPAPITDQWMRDAPGLVAEIPQATGDISLIEAPAPRAEALAIAMRLRQAAEDGESAALITPDRTLSRRVTAALERWRIRPDDSAGVPLHQSAPGRFLRHVSELLSGPVDAALLLTVLKHPLCFRTPERGEHLRLTRELELYIRRKGSAVLSADIVRDWASRREEPIAQSWAAWIGQHILTSRPPGPMPATDRVTVLVATAEALSNGTDAVQTCALWQGEAGAEARRCVSDLLQNADAAAPLGARDFAQLFYAELSQGSVRQSVEVHPDILIWGTLEARVQGVDLLILGGLNEGVWPEEPAQDPWMNRTMRRTAGLLLPDRRIGLSAHDFQQAVCHNSIWLTRSVRSDDAQTVPSRWLGRLKNLLSGMERGEKALQEMCDRGSHWLDLANKLESVQPVPKAARPSPAPPVHVRPRQLSVSDVRSLLRDPYAIYAKHVLKLRSLDPLLQRPDARLRGTVLHSVMERLVADLMSGSSAPTVELVLKCTKDVLDVSVPWAGARISWMARMARVADWIARTEDARRARALPARLEATGKIELEETGFVLTAKADRIDVTDTGDLIIYDYKTGTPPSRAAQEYLDKQLLIEAVIAENTGFDTLGPRPVREAVYVGLGTPPKEIKAPLDTCPVAKTRADLVTLTENYLKSETGFTSKRAAETVRRDGEYDQLARYGEWDLTDTPKPVILK
ncbi:MAG: double-strand break repair protein AddB [Pseudomonadota bacterium]